MVSESKILTVSYGTFSCTLEGFDDPFSTMRSIAEYFRDLAAGDRYFGAEPPVPDAEMLHRIAEREIQQRVEARIEDNSVVLRQANADAPDEKATLIAGEALLQEAEQAEADADAAEAGAGAEAKAAEAAGADADAVESHEDQQAAPDAAAEVAEAAKAETAQPLDITGDSIAAKLQRIRAVVDSRADDKSREDLEDGLGDDFYAEISQPEPEPFAPETEAGPEAETAGLDDDAFEAAEFVEFEAGDDGDSDGGDDDSDGGDISETVIAGLSAALATDETADEAADAKTAAAGSDSDSDSDNDGEIDLAEGLGSSDDSDADDDFEDENVFAETGSAQEDSDEDGEEDTGEGSDTAPQPVAIARIVKVRRAGVKPATADETPAKEPGEGNSSLSPEDEAALLAELAEVERENQPESTEAITAGASDDDGDGEGDEAAHARTAFDDTHIAGAEALDRILAETNTKLESDEASQKRSSIAHLRAAVQAKRADGETPGTDDEAQEDSAETYREDLARVVRPRRLGAGEGQVSRRLAPLVLVSEQRVDEAKATTDSSGSDDEQQHQQTIRPRRVVKPAAGAAQAEGAAPAATSGFAAFAAQSGAEGIGELLEAAAAYQIYVKGHKVFSRPQVMKMALKYDPQGNLSREEGLRAFGRLIREGVITKIQRGQFVISESTRFRPDPDQERARA